MHTAMYAQWYRSKDSTAAAECPCTEQQLGADDRPLLVACIPWVTLGVPVLRPTRAGIPVSHSGVGPGRLPCPHGEGYLPGARLAHRQ
jgi:hypothetical protein